MSDIFDHGFDAYMSALDDADPVALMNDRVIAGQYYNGQRRKHIPEPEPTVLRFRRQDYIAATPFAIKFEVFAAGHIPNKHRVTERIWLPKSQIHLETFRNGYRIHVPHWLMRKRPVLGIHEIFQISEEDFKVQCIKE